MVYRHSGSTNQPSTPVNKSILKHHHSTSTVDKDHSIDKDCLRTPNRKQHPNSPITPRHQIRDLSKSPVSGKLNQLKQTELVW